MRLLFLASLLAVFLCPAQVPVAMSQHNTDRTNANLSEVLLNTSNVRPATFGKLFARDVDNTAYAEPLVIPNVNIPGKGLRNVVYVATMSNTIYAFDADDPQESTPLWSRNYGNGPPDDSWFASTRGILGTPAVDLSTNTMYFVKTEGTATANHLWLHAVDIATGADKFFSPTQLLFPKDTGDLVPSTPHTIQRPGLLVSNGSVYIGIAYFRPDANESWISQDGFVVRYTANDIRTQQARFQTTPTGLKGGIWQAARGLAADAAGYLYVATAGGDWDGVTNFGSSVVRLHPGTLAVVDYYTPANHETLFHGNLDISGGGVILVPGTDYLVAGGKEGVIYLLKRSAMGNLDGAGAGAWQKFPGINGCMTDCAATLGTAWWNKTNPILYAWSRRDYLRAFAFNGSTLNTTPAAVGTLRNEMGGTPAVSANGGTAGTGIVWATTTAANANATVVPGVLRAYNALDITQEIWNSEMNSTRDSMGGYVKFAQPVVASGKVYMVTNSNKLQVYGPQCGVDVGSMVTVTRSGFRYVASTRKYLQTLTIRNNAPASLSGAVNVALDNLSSGATLANSAGSTSCAAPSGSPMATAFGLSGFLAAGASRTVTLEFTTTNNNPITYTPRVIAGGGAR